MAAEGWVKAFVAIVEVGVFWAGVTWDGAGLGELVDFFWKKPRIDLCPLADCDADAGCFFCDGRGVAISFPSTPRAIVLVTCGCWEWQWKAIFTVAAAGLWGKRERVDASR